MFLQLPKYGNTYGKILVTVLFAQSPYGISDEVQGCYGCFATVHHHCLMEDWRAERFPVCCACGEVAPEPLPPLPPAEEDPPCEDDRPDIIPVGPDLEEPEMSEKASWNNFRSRDLRHVTYTEWIIFPMILHVNTVNGP